MGVWREVEASKGHATSLRGNMCLLWALVDGGGCGNLFWGFGVITSRFGGGRARGCGLISGSLISRVVGRRLICQVKIGG